MFQSTSTHFERHPTQGFGNIGLCSNPFVSRRNSWDSPRAGTGTLKPQAAWFDPRETAATNEGDSTPESTDMESVQPESVQSELTEPDTAEPEPTKGLKTVRSMEDIDTRIASMWNDHKEETILGPYDYISSAPGKEFRTQLLGALNMWHKVSSESLECIANVIRLLHNASLLIDDIQDGSTLRRGRPVAHSVFGVAQTINSGNFVYFLALAELQKLSKPTEAIEIFTTEMLALHRGQGMDLYWRDVLSCPTEDEYLEMVSNKTGGLFRLAVKLMQSESDTGIDSLPFINILGLIFQITDDYKNLASLDYTAAKGYCEDLTEGKFSFPLIHSIHARPSNQILLNIIRQKTTDLDVKRNAVEYMESTGSFAYTRNFVDALVARAKAMAIELDTQCGKDSLITLSLVEKIARM